MKNLQDFVNEYPILNILETHFKIEFNIRSLSNLTVNIHEKYGKYDGEIEFIVEIAKALFAEIKTNLDKDIEFNIDKDDIEGFENVFFDNIKIVYKENTLNSGYDSKNVKYNEKTKTLNTVVIYVNPQENTSYNEIISTLVHEITHAWEDYNRFINNDKLSLYNISNSSNYKDLVNHINTFKDYGDLCAKILYMFKRFERNAYLSEFASTLDKEHKEINSYKDALELFEETDVYREYVILYEAFKKYYQNEKFVNYYNKANKTSLTANKIYKKLDNQFIKTFNKMSTLMPKLYYEYYEKQKKELNEGIMIHPSKAFMEQINLLIN